MEKRRPSSCPKNESNDNNKFKLDLKHLPPIDPYSITSTKNHQVKYEIPSRGITTKEETKSGDDGASLICLTKYIDPNSTSIDPNSTSTSSCSNEATGDGVSQNDSKIEGAPNKLSSKSKLLEICAANHWKPPLFECCNEEGPCHKKMFTYKVTFVIESSNAILECFGAPQSKKKTAAESAAEGALWFLKHLGYFPIQKPKK